jgi:hypothetical protein
MNIRDVLEKIEYDTLVPRAFWPLGGCSAKS